MPIFAAFSEGASIDAVTGHRHDLAIGLQRIDDPQFLFGHRAGEDCRGSHGLQKIGLAHGFELGAGEDIAGLEIGLGGNRTRCLRIVTGDHDDADAGGAAFLDRRRHGRAQRIRKADKAEKREREFAWRLRTHKTGGYRCARNGEHAHAFLGHLVEGTADLRPIAFR